MVEIVVDYLGKYSRKPGWNMWRENACIRDGEFKKRKQGIIEYS